MWLKSKYVWSKPRYYKLLTEKRIRKFTFLKYSHFFENVLLLPIPRNYFQTPSLGYKLLGDFKIVKISYFRERPNKVK